MANYNWHKGQPSANPNGRPRGSKTNKLLSNAYKKILGEPISEHLKEMMDLPDSATYADAIATQVVGKALGHIKDDEICFVAIKELRETTEGKTPEKAILASGNSELASLARIMAGEPAATGEESDAATAEDSDTEDAEAEFHSSVDDGA